MNRSTLKPPDTPGPGSGNPPARRARLVVLGGVCLAAIGSIYLVPPGADRALLIIVASLVCFAAYLGALRWAGGGAGSPAVVIGAALAMRLALVPAAPCTSNDVYRYLWEGLIQLEGHNPYAEAPLDASLDPLRAAHTELVGRINHPDCPTIYGPLAQRTFALAAWVVPGSVIAWKLLLLVVETTIILILYATQRAAARPPACQGFLLLAYLWCPLVVFETYEAGHLDCLGVGLLLLSWTLRARCWWASALMLGGSVAVKYFWPLLVLPLVLRSLGGWWRRGAYVGIVGAVAGGLFLPYMDGHRRLASVCARFLEKWRFGGPFALIERFLADPWWAPLAVAGGILLVAVLLLAWRSKSPDWPEVQLALGTGLILSPVVYPWYLLWLAPGLMWRRGWTWLTWVGLACVWHEVQIGYQARGEWQPNVLLVGGTMILFCVLLLAEWRRWFVRLRTRAEAPGTVFTPGR